MILSNCMAISADGLLIYLGQSSVYLILGGKNGQINMIKIS